MKLALKIDVDTYRGTREGVPRLIELLQRHQADATFLFNLGADRSGRILNQLLRRGFLRKAPCISRLQQYGLKTLLYGTLLPAPDIGKRCADILRATRDQGFEVGIHCIDRIAWQERAARSDAAWTAQQLKRAIERFQALFGERARTHGAAAWQTNIHALRLEQQSGMDYASDTRGTHPFIPVWQAEIIACPQLPTTLPTLDELIGVNGINAGNVAQHLLSLTENPPPSGHVYTLRAELEGGPFADVFEALLVGWKEQGVELVSLARYQEDLDRDTLPRHEIVMGTVPGRTGEVALQGEEFLSQ
jgi:peptidoglycan/xylan/chitin deacetylase (PgdA/CDA1 family)